MKQQSEAQLNEYHSSKLSSLRRDFERDRLDLKNQHDLAMAQMAAEIQRLKDEIAR